MKMVNMNITHLAAKEIAKKCEHQENLFCRKRYEYRDCDRPMCCGFCNTVDICEDICSLILIKFLEQTNEKDN